jgi:hypothetical protein
MKGEGFAQASASRRTVHRRSSSIPPGRFEPRLSGVAVVDMYKILRAETAALLGI